MTKTIVAKNKPSNSWLVRGENWTYEVQTSSQDMMFPLNDQAEEAATKAIEVFKGITPVNNRFILDSGEKDPYISLSLDVYLQNSSKDVGFSVLSHEALANAGCYKDSWIAYIVYLENLCDLIKEDKKATKDMIEISKFFKGIIKEYHRIEKEKKKKKK